MSISNITVPNNYYIYTNKHPDKDITLKAQLPTNYSVANDIIVKFGCGNDNVPHYAFSIYKGVWTIDNNTGVINVPKSGLYLVILKTNHITTSSAGLVSVRDTKFLTNSDGSITYIKSQRSYNMAEAGQTIEDSISSIIYMDENEGYIFKSHIIVLSGIGNVTYKGAADPLHEDYNSLTIHYLD